MSQVNGIEAALTHIIPKAKPFLFTNHWSTYITVGQYTRLPPIAYRTPCVKIRCPTVVENEDIESARHMVMSPAAKAGRCVTGHHCIMANVSGQAKYIIPMAQVPMTATLGEPANGSWEL